MIEHLNRYTLPAALSLLPKAMDTPHARAMLLAIALQESKCCHRRQILGPARGFYQFEKGGGVKGVLIHWATKAHAVQAMQLLQYPDCAVETAYAAIEHNDTLATVFARLLLYTLPDKLPTDTQTNEAWMQYLAAWRPGKPHPETWNACFARAWSLV